MGRIFKSDINTCSYFPLSCMSSEKKMWRSTFKFRIKMGSLIGKVSFKVGINMKQKLLVCVVSWVWLLPPAGAVLLCCCCCCCLPASPGLTALLSLHPQGSCAALSPCRAPSASAPIAPRATSSSTWRTFTCQAMSWTLNVASVAINSRASGICTSTFTVPITYVAARKPRWLPLP